VKQFNKGTLTGSSPDKVVAHWKAVSSLSVKVSDLNIDIKDAKNTINVMLKAYDKAISNDAILHTELLSIRSQLLELTQQIRGSKIRSEVGEKDEYPTIGDYMWKANSSSSTYGPTAGQLQSLENANTLYDRTKTKLKNIEKSMIPLEEKLIKIGAPKIRN